MLEVRIARKGFAGKDILRDVAFSVTAGEIVGLLGPSGIGKSTLLRILLGLDAAFDGTVRRGFRHAGTVFQEPRLLPWLTVAENIRLVVPPDLPAPDVGALLDLVQLGPIAAMHPSQLSLGMARRVALARALAVGPDLLVLDEPFASLDARLAATLFDAVTRWAASTGATVLLATHDLPQALDRVSRLLVVAGAPATLHADESVPPGSNGKLLAALVTRFPFLGASAPENTT